MEPIVQAHNVGYSIGPRTLWRGLTLELAPGVMTALTGPSGAGKSTMLNCLGLLDRPSEGELVINGEATKEMTESQARKLRRDVIGYLFQDFALIDTDSVYDNVALAAPVELSRKERKARISAALATVGLTGREQEKAYVLSGGEQQRVAMARILVRDPALVLADEPTASLDRVNAQVVLDLLRARADQGATVVIVSHDPWVVGHCDERVELAA